MDLYPTLDLTDAEVIAVACREAAVAKGVNVSIAIVDGSGGLLTFLRMDGARAYTAEFAQTKARAAASAGVSTGVIAQVRPGTERSGLPAFHQKRSAGAVGVSGAPTEVDEHIAASGLAALEAVWATPSPR